MTTSRRQFITTSALAAASALVPAPLTALAAPARRGPAEFRGGWVASVYNLDWPSRPGLSPAAAKAELIRLIDRMQALHMNAMIFQVRPNGDALYRSSIEPSSHWLTGSMGARLSWDPLEVAVEECHRRGMELHAWFNPFRALSGLKKAPSRKHLSRRRPDWVRTMGKHIWFDPAEPGVQNHALKVITDVVRRYDIDGVHLDDYFYPYPKKKAGRRIEEFPDMHAFQKSGMTNRDAWRRANINHFVKNLYHQVHETRQSVKVGISPFGIWRPGVPAGTNAMLDAYNDLAADSHFWLRQGWVDYMSPQLYWADGGEQSFSALLQWWQSINPKGRHIWPGIDITGERGHATSMVSRQVRITRTTRQAPAPGQVLWRTGQLLDSRKHIAQMLRRDLYNTPATIPPCPWLA
ncbi:glycoside hydrolase family 10 protein [Sulfuriroseicoccus oceanibius]|uniref:Family 10 glycosylhydrolase n=1 Tax=Sulfuriroseicoccus oceanibius TaxID=2707525 RepID=A0A6B3L0Y8_9BACT|nr:family 10 glycosylhydrolase [Sulfuriroseicoccus oceanibius]QQL44213.1 family 10 glycosylhydrolase [Sulfuriroseicoccus oceanibius]